LQENIFDYETVLYKKSLLELLRMQGRYLKPPRFKAPSLQIQDIPQYLLKPCNMAYQVGKNEAPGNHHALRRLSPDESGMFPNTSLTPLPFAAHSPRPATSS
jgi:hypothetical protein